MSDNRADDLIGLKGLSDSVRIATEGLRDGAGAFLSRLCLPGAEELGFALRDRISGWRARNALQMLNAAHEIYRASPHRQEDDRLSPRLVHVAIEEASWIEDAQVRSMWAGLLAASTARGTYSDENLLFMNLLKQLTVLQVQILEFAVERTPKTATSDGLVVPRPIAELPVSELLDRLDVRDLQRLDRELDHLRELGLVGDGNTGGINVISGDVELTASPLAFHLYVRGHGSRLSPAAYWNLKLPAETMKRGS